MKWLRVSVVLLALAAQAAPAAAGLFSKSAKPNPAERVPQLIVTVKTEQDDSKRAAAAVELRQFDTKTFPEIVPVLVDVLQNDPKPNVRAEAAQSLGKLRPVTPEVGTALSQAAAKDKSRRVRLQARTSLTFYHLSGYHAPKAKDPPAGPAGTTGPAGPAGPARPARPTTAEPPLAAPEGAGPMLLPVPSPMHEGARPLPPGPPEVTPAPKPATPAPPQDQGPTLTPPQ
jgi:hypothetical protein